LYFRGVLGRQASLDLFDTLLEHRMDFPGRNQTASRNGRLAGIEGGGDTA
jgi:hypothetical protein